MTPAASAIDANIPDAGDENAELGARGRGRTDRRRRDQSNHGTTRHHNSQVLFHVCIPPKPLGPVVHSHRRYSGTGRLRLASARLPTRFALDGLHLLRQHISERHVALLSLRINIEERRSQVGVVGTVGHPLEVTNLKLCWSFRAAPIPYPNLFGKIPGLGS